MSNFILGLKLETEIASSGDCIDNIVYTIDDTIYLLNNITDVTWRTFEAPVMNASKAIGGNFSFIPLNCYQAGNSFVTKTVTKFQSFDGVISDFFLAFLYNLMGNALKLKQALEDIANDQKNQYYVDIALQWGKIIYLVTSFDSSDLASISQNKEQYNHFKNVMFDDLEPKGIPDFEEFEQLT